MRYSEVNIPRMVCNTAIWADFADNFERVSKNMRIESTLKKKEHLQI